MAGATGLTGLIPPYASIGLLGPILLVICRPKRTDGSEDGIAFQSEARPLLELFRHKWGEPKQGDDALVFRDDDPRVEVREDKEHGAWQVELK